MTRFTWNLCSPMYRPNTYDAGNLGLDYTDGADARFPNPGLVLGPQRTSLDCTSAGTAANTNSGQMIRRTSGGTDWFLILGNGNRYTKLIVPSGNTALSKASTQPGSSFGARIMSMVVSQKPGGNPMLSFGLASGTYQNLTAVAAENASDTTSANDQSKAWKILGMAPDRVMGFGTGTINGNILTSSVDMDASAWQEISKYDDPHTSPTGFAMSDNLVLAGTTKGVNVHHVQYKEFFPAFGNVPANAHNCRAMRYIPWLGVLVPLVGQLRLMNGSQSMRVGPEAFGSPNVVQGTGMGIGFNADWTFIAIRNPKTSTTYLCAGRPRQSGDWHFNPVSFFCIDSFSAECEWVDVLEDPDGIRTNQVLAVGAADDIYYYRIGRTTNWTDDVSGSDYYLYRTDTDQSAYGNWMHFDQAMKITRVTWEGSGLASTRPLKVSVGYQTKTGQTGTVLVNTQNRSGRESLPLPPSVRLEDIRAFRPEVTLRSSVATATPCLEHGRISIEAEPLR